MKRGRFHLWAGAAGAVALLSAAAVVVFVSAAGEAKAGIFGHGGHKTGCCEAEGPPTDDVGGTWYWLRSPDEESCVVTGLFNRYCIRCHGVDGRGVWDIPDVPDFTNVRWQASRSDGQLARSFLQGQRRHAPLPRHADPGGIVGDGPLPAYLRTRDGGFAPGPRFGWWPTRPQDSVDLPFSDRPGTPGERGPSALAGLVFQSIPSLSLSPQFGPDCLVSHSPNCSSKV